MTEQSIAEKINFGDKYKKKPKTNKPKKKEEGILKYFKDKFQDITS